MIDFSKIAKNTEPDKNINPVKLRKAKIQDLEQKRKDKQIYKVINNVIDFFSSSKNTPSNIILEKIIADLEITAKKINNKSFGADVFGTSKQPIEEIFSIKSEDRNYNALPPSYRNFNDLWYRRG